MVRVAWLLAGVAWAVRSLLELARPAYYAPVTQLDWAAVATYSFAWLASALAVPLLVRDRPVPAVRISAAVFTVAATVTGLANLVEDALDLSWAGTFYLAGFVVAWVSLIPLAIAMWRSGAHRLAALPVSLFVTVALFTVGGGLVMLVVATLYAVAPGWFAADRATGTAVVPGP